MRRYDLKDRRVLLLALAGLVLLLVLLVVTVRNMVVGTPDPKLPNEALFYTPPITRWDDKGVAPRSADFTARPLFSDSRRPFEAAPAQTLSQAAEQPVAKGPVQTLEGWSLLGIFNSGEVEGAIVRQNGKAPARVKIGQRIEGWVLLSVGPRRALFRSDQDGSEAQLDMALNALDALVRQPPFGSRAEEERPEDSATPPTSMASGEGVQGQALDSKKEAEAKRRDTTTFKGYYQND